MTYDEFDVMYDNSYDLFTEHAEYIMDNCHGDRIICNGDDLVIAQEEGYLYEEFREHWIEKQWLELNA